MIAYKERITTSIQNLQQCKNIDRRQTGTEN